MFRVYFTEYLLSTYGAVDQLKTFDVSLWLRAWQTESASSVQFENWADDILLTDLAMV